MDFHKWMHALGPYWADFSWMIAFMIFVAYIVLDILFALYTLAVSELRPIQASNAGSLMYFLLGFTVFTYTKNPLYIPAIAAGSWIGTYLVVEHKRRKKLNKGDKN